jgi:DNA-binding SARP family transcriptional activator
VRGSRGETASSWPRLSCRARVVPAERLADAAYGEDPPPTWRKVLQNSIVRLRRALGPRAIETTAAGYRLTLGDEEIDSRRFERLVAEATERAVTHEHGRVVALLTEALSLFLGRPLSDLDDWEPGQAEAARLEELRRVAEEHLVDALIADGRPEEATTLLTRLTAQEPYREQRWASLALAQYRAGNPNASHAKAA